MPAFTSKCRRNFCKFKYLMVIYEFQFLLAKVAIIIPNMPFTK